MLAFFEEQRMDKENQPKTREEWFQLIKEQENSNLSQGEFCKQYNLIPCRFSYYRQIYRQQFSPPKLENNFSTVVIKNEIEENHNQIVINLPNRVSLSLSNDFSLDQLKKIFGALISC